MNQTALTPIQSGSPAPDFAVPAVHDDRMISLGDYRGKTPLLLGLFPGLYCPFCRRALAQMAATSEHLKSLGVDTLAIVATDLDNARFYFRFRPTRIPVGADPQLTTHRSYGVPRPEPTREMLKEIEHTYVNPTGELPTPLPVPAAGEALTKLDGYQLTPTDERDFERMFTQMRGQYLIDRNGIVRWSFIECAKEGLPGLGKFPSHDELVAAATTVIP